MKKFIVKSFIFSVLFIGIGFFLIKGWAALSPVTSGLPLSASTWNNMISNFYWGSGSGGIYYNGNVGIGTTTPSGLLNVKGNSLTQVVLDAPLASALHLIFQSAGASKYSIYRPGGTNDLSFDSNLVGNVLYLTNAGNVGIGTTTPSVKLEVNGRVNLSNGYLSINSSSPVMHLRGTSTTYKVIEMTDTTTNKGWQLGHRAASESNNFTLFYYNGSTRKNVMTILTGGNVGIGISPAGYLLHVNGTAAGTSWANLSDMRFKKNIETITGALDKITNLRGVKFDWRVGEFSGRNFSKGNNIGFVAQEVEKIIPQVVNTDKEGYKAVEYSNLTAVLVEAIKEQEKKFNDQKQLIQSQQQKIDLLEDQINELKNRIGN